MPPSGKCSGTSPIRWWAHSVNAPKRCTVANDEAISVEVAYARADEQLVISLQVAPGTSLQSAIERSGICERFPEIDMAVVKAGIFGKAAALDTPLKQGDRVEIYRPLIADPKEARKRRAAEGKQMKKGGGDLPAEE
ncbi:MAG: RnfH family protein [Chromatiaceae bacterium]|nr:RnfH family protein [Chromatiaceae bacterium]